jgi:enoyl-CoA hydratase
MLLNAHKPDAVLKIERHHNSYVLTFNRPKAGNSISLDLAEEIESALAEIAKESDVSAIILTGEGDKFFCSGGDVKKYAQIKETEELEEAFGKISRMLDTIENMDIPVIAAINGFAIGGGMELSVACDIRIIDENAQIGFPQTRIGLILGWFGTERLLQLVGRGSAMKMLMTGDRIDASQAYRICLVDQIAPSGQVVQAALEVADRIALAGPLAIRSMKKVVRACIHESRENSRAIAKKEFAKLWFTYDHKEAENAFIEKRPPKFLGY